MSLSKVNVTPPGARTGAGLGQGLASIRALGRRSIRFRLSALFVTIFGTTLIMFSVFQYQVFVRTHQTEFDAALYNHAVDVSQGIDIDVFGELSVQTGAMNPGVKLFPFSPLSAFVEVRSLDGKVMGRSRNLGHGRLPFFPEDMPVLNWRGATFRELNAGSLVGLPIERNTNYRMIIYLIDRPLLTKLVLQIAVPLTFLEQERSSLLAFLLVSIPVTLLIAALGGLFLSRRALAPVIAIIEAAQEIGVTQLSERVPVPAVDDEIRQLALTLNALLDRLQNSFEGQDQFISDASHQLKTPLSILRGEMDLMQSRPRTSEEIQEFLQSGSQEINHLSKVVEDLLLLARVDAGKGALSIQPVRMDEVALEAVSRLESAAAKKSVRIRANLLEDIGAAARSDGLHGAYEVQGDAGTLQVMLHNLIENAIKFSPPGTSVYVTVHDSQTAVEVEVRDEGPGVALDARERIFERFYRAEETRNRAPGVGLGLAIVRRIAEVHGGSVYVAGNGPAESGPGATFRVRIPKTA